VISWLFEFCCFHIQLVPLRIGRFIYAAESGDEEDEAARDGGGGGGHTLEVKPELRHVGH
jgi:hypothetical protein